MNSEKRMRWNFEQIQTVQKKNGGVEPSMRTPHFFYF